MTNTTICPVCATAITEADTAPCDTSECPIPMPAVKSPAEIIRGTFTQFEVPVIAADRTAEVNAIAKAHAELVRELSAVVPPRIHVSPIPEEFEDAADYILRVGAMVDRWLLAVGTEVKCNSTANVNLEWFRDMVVGNCDGWCTAECDKAANELREEQEDYRDNPGPMRLYRSIMGAGR